MNKRLRVLLCLLIRMAPATASFALIVVVANRLIVWGFTHNYPYDPSAGGTAGWAFVFLMPLIVPLEAVISLALGFLAYLFARARVSVGWSSREIDGMAGRIRAIFHVNSCAITTPSGAIFASNCTPL